MTLETPTLTLSEDHVYRLGDRLLPGVTQIINATIPRPWEVHQWYLTRGAALHKAIQLLAAGNLDWSTVDESYKGKLAAYQKFIQETAYHIHATELRLYSKSLRFAGTVDAICRTPDLTSGVLVDWKSSLEAQVEIQLGAYRRLLWDNEIDISKALALELHDDGTYKCQWFTKAELKRAEQAFCACLTIYGWKAKHKLNGERR